MAVSSNTDAGLDGGCKVVGLRGLGSDRVESRESAGSLAGAAAQICRAALERGPLVRHDRHWRYGRRLFSNVTVNRLVAQGWAVRDGGTIRRAD